MDNIKNIIGGGIITLVIGGTAYTFNQEAVVNNFAEDTGVTQQEAQEYVSGVEEDELSSYEELGNSLIAYSVETLKDANDIDCVNYEYEWESPALTCDEGKNQLNKIGKSEELLGQSYIKLQSDSATKVDMQNTIQYLDELSVNYDSEIYKSYYDEAQIKDLKMTNSFNKSMLKAALDSN